MHAEDQRFDAHEANAFEEPAAYVGETAAFALESRCRAEACRNLARLTWRGLPELCLRELSPLAEDQNDDYVVGLRCRETAAHKSADSTGFDRKPCIPCCRHSRRNSSDESAVRARIGTSA
jgi:hypothetical protein